MSLLLSTAWFCWLVSLWTETLFYFHMLHFFSFHVLPVSSALLLLLKTIFISHWANFHFSSSSRITLIPNPFLKLLEFLAWAYQFIIASLTVIFGIPKAPAGFKNDWFWCTWSIHLARCTPSLLVPTGHLPICPAWRILPALAVFWILGFP